MSEGTMLLKHGTELVRLKPVNILQAAIADLKLRTRKKQGRADPEALYSFARRHVMRTIDPVFLIALAYFEPQAAFTTDKHSTLIIYTDRALLCETLIDLLRGDLDLTDELSRADHILAELRELEEKEKEKAKQEAEEKTAGNPPEQPKHA